MSAVFLRPLTILLFICLISCGNPSEKKGSGTTTPPEQAQDTTAMQAADSVAADTVAVEEEAVEEFTLLDEENAIPFFFEYQKEHLEDKVRVYTSMGNFDLDLYEETPYHRANFIFLAKREYFDGTYFHRVVRDFIIQGGNSDNRSVVEKRKNIGHYLLPPDTKKGFKHHRGTISMPSSDNVRNPHKLASPFEFFIVVTQPGSYHLDGNYTAFGRVTKGMDVVDAINKVKTDKSEWPIANIRIDSVRIME